MRSTLHPTLQYLLRHTLLYAVREYCQCALPEASCNTHGCSLPRPRLPPTCTRAYGRRCGCGCGCACSRRAPTASTCTSSSRATSPYAQRRRPASQPHPHPPCTRTHPALAPTLCPLCRLTAPTRVTQPHLATHAAPALRPAALCPHCALPAASARRAEAPTAPLTAPRRPRPTQHLRCRHRRTTPRPSTGGARCWRRVWCRSPPAAS